MIFWVITFQHFLKSILYLIFQKFLLDNIFIGK